MKTNLSLLFVFSFLLLTGCNSTEEKEEKVLPIQRKLALRMSTSETNISDKVNQQEISNLSGYLFEGGILTEIYPNLSVNDAGIVGGMSVPDKTDAHLYLLANIGELPEAGLFIKGSFLENSLKDLALVSEPFLKQGAPLAMAGYRDIGSILSEKDTEFSLTRSFARIDIEPASGIAIKNILVDHVAQSGYLLPQSSVQIPANTVKGQLEKNYEQPLETKEEGVFYFYEQTGDAPTVTVTAQIDGKEEILTTTLPDTILRNQIYYLKITSEGGIVEKKPAFTVSPQLDIIEFDAAAKTLEVIVTCRDQDVELNVTRAGDTWLRVGEVQTDASNPLKKTFTIQVFENSSGSLRFGKVIIKADDTTHEYFISQSEEKVTLPYTVEFKYKGVALGENLRVPAKGAKGTLTMKSSSGEIDEDGFLSLRAAEGTSWVKIGNEFSFSFSDQIYHDCAGSFLEFDENLGDERQMTAEFYSKTSGIVYHRMYFIQEASVDYINLSATSLNADRYGNIFDEPFALEVESNQVWELRCMADWVKLRYTPGNRSQTVEVAIEENQSGSARNAELEFIIGGNTIKQFPISQSVTENSTFTLKYEINLIMTTINDRFKGTLATNPSIIYYANDVQIYNPGTSAISPDETIKRQSGNPYGFIVDAPASFNRIEVNNIADRLLVYRNYRGTAASQPNNGGITIRNSNYSQSIFRRISFTLPIPAGVRRTQKVVYNMTINNITNNAAHDTPIITHTIEEQ